ARVLPEDARFVQQGNDGATRRTIHLGIDVFAPAGTPVHAPLDGVVHSIADGSAPGDHGPAIVLAHETGGPAGDVYTLYGRLSRDSLARWRPGDRVRGGEPIAAIGSIEENGGRAPHLHLQVIGDLLGFRGDFPGVAEPAAREAWLSLCPDPTPLLGLDDGRLRAPRVDVAALRARRRALIGPSVRLSYHRPLLLVRGDGQFLYDHEGRRYLDAVNNVAHVGHSHPRVVRAVASQLAALTTNTRYLHETLLRYAERLTARLPDPLRVCYVVNSGSEANELALRLARTHTGRRDVLVLDGAYHGNTSALVEMSPYKFNGPGGGGAPPWVHVAPMPDPYRGLHRGPDAGPAYVERLRAVVAEAEARGRPLAAFFCEPVMSCAGQIVPPPGFLAGAAAAAREAGALVVCDEVQIGFGRLGHWFWGFEAQGVVPDIVTMGKPAGNGFPLGVVVTTREITASFDNGMEYFTTFGGAPPACAAGLAVLDVIEEEGLPARAAEVGACLVDRLRELARRFPIIGDVRGLGLFLGIELVETTDRPMIRPARRQARYVVNRLRDRGVLVSTDGPDDNVIKIKPPLAFSRRDADELVDALEVVLGEDPAQPA
ncbi:MAG TPA: aminotransferase class III-fold pyridoxal phosphate-dependent enzyme, partial [Vicinamibacterales bacterium]|nr:aminotransferase class III-fold pyridoxal phosphate-dependent enzyme [Vicinamibacterales bacterium]